MLGEGLRLAAIGAAIGVLGALAASRVMKALVVFGPNASAADPRLIAAVVAVMMTVAGLAAFLPARRASRVDPMIVLRHE